MVSVIASAYPDINVRWHKFKFIFGSDQIDMKLSCPQIVMVTNCTGFKNMVHCADYDATVPSRPVHHNCAARRLVAITSNWKVRVDQLGLHPYAPLLYVLIADQSIRSRQFLLGKK